MASNLWQDWLQARGILSLSIPIHPTCYTARLL